MADGAMPQAAARHARTPRVSRRWRPLQLCCHCVLLRAGCHAHARHRAQQGGEWHARGQRGPAEPPLAAPRARARACRRGRVQLSRHRMRLSTGGGSQPGPRALQAGSGGAAGVAAPARPLPVLAAPRCGPGAARAPRGSLLLLECWGLLLGEMTRECAGCCPRLCLSHPCVRLKHGAAGHTCSVSGHA